LSRTREVCTLLTVLVFSSWIVMILFIAGSNKRGRMTVEEQRASARRFAEANFTKTVKKTSEKKISKRRAKDVQEEEEEEEEEEVEEEEAEVPKSLTKLQEAKLKQRELLAQRAKEKAEQIRSAKRRPSMAGKKR
jgi:Ca2+-dependent lipid-binding protein